jgi:hypothetical protein
MRKPTHKCRKLSKKVCREGNSGRKARRPEPSKPLKVMAFDEARFGLINWHTKRYCPKGFRPPYIVRRAYKWTYLYAAVEPTTGESFCLYVPGMDSRCLHSFLEGLSLKPTPRTICSWCSMVPQAIAQKRWSAPRTWTFCAFLPTLPNSTR